MTDYHDPIEHAVTRAFELGQKHERNRIRFLALGMPEGIRGLVNAMLSTVEEGPESHGLPTVLPNSDLSSTAEARR